MSLIEVMIAAGILLVIALGVLPLVTRSMGNNLRGWEATEASNYVKDQLEGYSQMGFSHPTLTIPDGQTKLTVTRQWTAGDPQVVGDPNEGWWDPAVISSKGPGTWSRQTEVRQFQITNLGTPLPGGTSTEFVHVKEQMVRMVGARQAGPLGAGQTLSVRMLKAF